jgi:hypothetical protein
MAGGVAGGGKLIRLSRAMPVVDRASWPETIAWLVGNAVSFKREFGPRILAMEQRS